MSIDEFRNNEMLSTGLAELLKNDILRTALSVCDQASPANGGNRVWDQPHLAHIQLGIDRGYNLYSQVLKTLAIAPKKQEEVQPTYEVVQEEKEE